MTRLDLSRSGFAVRYLSRWNIAVGVRCGSSIRLQVIEEIVSSLRLLWGHCPLLLEIQSRCVLVFSKAGPIVIVTMVTEVRG